MATRRERVLANLSATDRLVRLEAARQLGEVGTAKDRGAAIRALDTESDPWVRRELGVTIRALRRARGPIDVPDLPLDTQVEELRGAIEQQVAELVLHEIRPLVGAAKLAGAAEIVEFDESDTKRSLDRISDLLEALALLSRAAAPSGDVSEFDMAEAVAALTREVLGDECELDQILAGPQPAPVEGSRPLFDIVVRNGLTNAKESLADRADRPPGGGIVVSWGVSGSEYWLSILDDGVGFSGSSSALFDLGHSTKSDETNFGLGLAIARRAARSMGGDLELFQRAPVGAAYEFRWPKRDLVSDANSVR